MDCSTCVIESPKLQINLIRYCKRLNLLLSIVRDCKRLNLLQNGLKFFSNHAISDLNLPISGLLLTFHVTMKLEIEAFTQVYQVGTNKITNHNSRQLLIAVAVKS